MTFIRTLTPDEADEPLREQYARVRDPRTGELDNIMTVHSLHPAGLSAHFELYRAAMKGTKGLRTVDREMVALMVSGINACHY